MSGTRRWHSQSWLWERLKPAAREMRRKPTLAEEALWQRLRDRRLNGLRFRRQHALGQFVADFYCREAGLVIEVDGAIHSATSERDRIRQEMIEAMGLRVVRFSNDEILNSIDDVLAAISSQSGCETPHPPGPLSVDGEGVEGRG